MARKIQRIDGRQGGSVSIPKLSTLKSVAKQWEHGVGNASEWLPKAKRWNDEDPIMVFDHRIGNLRKIYKDKDSRSAEKLTPQTVLKRYQEGNLKKSLLPTRIAQLGLVESASEFTADEALEILQNSINQKTGGPALRKPLPKKKSSMTGRKMTLIGFAQFGGESAPTQFTGNGLTPPKEQAGLEKNHQLEYESDRAMNKRHIVEDVGQNPHTVYNNDGTFPKILSNDEKGQYPPSVERDKLSAAKNKLLQMSDDERRELKNRLRGIQSVDKTQFVESDKFTIQSKRVSFLNV